MPAAGSAESRQQPSVGDDVVIRAAGVFGLGAVAVIHMSQIVPTMEQTPWLGTGFVALAVACSALAARLLHRGGRAVWAVVIMVNAVTIAGYTLTRSVSTPIDDQDVGNWSENLGVASLFIEAWMVVLAAHALAGRIPTRSKSAIARSPTIHLDHLEQAAAAPSASPDRQPQLRHRR